VPQNETKEENKMVQKKRVTLQSLITNQKEIWVRNKVASLGKGSGAIFISISSDSAESIMIPPGSDPVCITEQIDPESLKSCRDLFKLVNKGVLELLDPDDAEKYYENRVDRKEKVAQKIRKYTNKVQDDKLPKEITFSQSNTGVNPRLPGLCLKAKKLSISEEDLFEDLLENQESLKEEDFNYLTTNGYFGSVKEWAKDQLNKIEDPVEEASK
jgi:hypothetical protein